MARSKTVNPETEQKQETPEAPQMWVCACGATIEATHKNYLKGWRLPKHVPTCPECVKRAKESQ